jgi:anaerobic selenocysteine-containing dehydrogenase
VKRREFIILTGIGATGTTLLSACAHPEDKLIPVLIPDNEYVPGVDYWKASTCGLCDADCGIVVRTREHRANKIEGNPLHPVNRGALCARGQAGLEVLYNPDRITGPMKRVGERGEGRWQSISWDEAIKTLSDKLRETDPASKQVLFLTGDGRGVDARVAERLMEALQQESIISSSFFDRREEDNSYLKSYGGVPGFDLANATLLISFGARFLETWRSPVKYSRAYGEFRSTNGKQRGRFVHVEPRMSLTAADADEWLPAVPGTEGLVALALAQVIVRESTDKLASLEAALEEFSPESTSNDTGIPAENVVRLGRDFANAERPLAIGSLDGVSMPAVGLLNLLVGNLNKKGGVLLAASAKESFDPFKMLAAVDKNGVESKSSFPDAQRLTQLRVLMVHKTNPVYLKRVDITKVPFIASFSSFVDETTVLADLVLPDHSYLERWDARISDSDPNELTLSLSQPVVETQFDTRQTADVLLAVASELGGEASLRLPFKSAKDLVEQASREFRRFTSAGPPVRKGENAAAQEDGWTELLGRGVAVGSSDFKPSQAQPERVTVPEQLLKSQRELMRSKRANPSDQLTLLVYEQASIGDGLWANLPSLQELPDPMTSVVWGTWVEINPKTASSLGISDGDLVELETENGKVRAPAFIYPAIRPEVVAMPLGQGHSGYGRYARNRGSNPALLLPQGGAGSSLQCSIRAKLTKVGGKSELIRFGTELMEHMESKR